MRVLCTLVMALSALPVLFVLAISAIEFHKPQYDAMLMVGAIFFSGALIARSILEFRPEAGNR